MVKPSSRSQIPTKPGSSLSVGARAVSSRALGPARILTRKTLAVANAARDGLAGGGGAAFLMEERTAGEVLPDEPASASLAVSPSTQLAFTGPFTHRSHSTLCLTNVSYRQRVAFKIKSTAPKGRLAVKPCRGVVEPRQEVKVEFTLMPVSRQPDKCPPSYRVLVEAAHVDRKTVDLDSVFLRPQSKESALERNVGGGTFCAAAGGKKVMVHKLEIIYNMPMLKPLVVEGHPGPDPNGGANANRRFLQPLSQWNQGNGWGQANQQQAGFSWDGHAQNADGQARTEQPGNGWVQDNQKQTFDGWDGAQLKQANNAWGLDQQQAGTGWNQTQQQQGNVVMWDQNSQNNRQLQDLNQGNSGWGQDVLQTGTDDLSNKNQQKQQGWEQGTIRWGQNNQQTGQDNHQQQDWSQGNPGWDQNDKQTGTSGLSQDSQQQQQVWNQDNQQQQKGWDQGNSGWGQNNQQTSTAGWNQDNQQQQQGWNQGNNGWDQDTQQQTGTAEWSQDNQQQQQGRDQANNGWDQDTQQQTGNAGWSQDNQQQQQSGDQANGGWGDGQQQPTGHSTGWDAAGSGGGNWDNNPDDATSKNNWCNAENNAGGGDGSWGSDGWSSEKKVEKNPGSSAAAGPLTVKDLFLVFSLVLFLGIILGLILSVK